MPEPKSLREILIEAGYDPVEAMEREISAEYILAELDPVLRRLAAHDRGEHEGGCPTEEEK